MDDEKMLPLGEPTLRFNPPLPTPSIKAAVPTNLSKVMKPAEKYVPPNLPGVPSPKQQQWGVLISIVIIVLMIIIGAFYAWGQRIAQNQVPSSVGF